MLRIVGIDFRTGDQHGNIHEADLPRLNACLGGLFDESDNGKSFYDFLLSCEKFEAATAVSFIPKLAQSKVRLAYVCYICSNETDTDVTEEDCVYCNELRVEDNALKETLNSL